jgi:hypothetical protein
MSQRAHPRVDTLLLGSLYLFEVSAGVLALALPRLVGRPLRAALVSHPGLYAILTLVGLVVSGALILQRAMRDRRQGSHRFALTVAVNLLPVTLVVVVGEVVTRALVVRAPEGEVLGATLLLPRDWGYEVTRNRALLTKAETAGSYLVPDELLGWTVGPSRRSADGLNQSSVEGIRSPEAGMSFAARRPAKRIALGGDSFTFALDVGYEDSWGHRLEQLLGPQVQVLNFGVPGYGVDQAYLRYSRDGRRWHPDVVILGVFPGDLGRSMGAYPFIYLAGEDLPFTKPRFVLKAGALSLLNVPLLTPEGALSMPSITALPFVEYDTSYRPSDWQWRPYHVSYLVRLVLSRYTVVQRRSPAVSEEALRAINAELVREFVRLVRSDGAVPLVLYLPGRGEFLPWAAEPRNLPVITREVLRGAGVEYTDLTRCVAAVPEQERFVPGRSHYSPRTNAAIAVCLRDLVSSAAEPGAIEGSRFAGY